ncbi:MAG: sigma-70 family RNA polymerase sigma factor [Phycisphaerae bacterium]|nr:sigma-70 family RNA polymerase sigma factor [Phycisphaerae bacterium]
MLARTTHVTLLERLSAGEDRSAWREFCDRYGDLIRGFARRAGCNENDTDDILQDALVSLVSAMPSFRYDPTRGRFRSYLKTIIVRAVARKSCQNSGVAPLGEEDDAISPDTEANERHWELEWRQYHLRLAMRTIESEFSVHDRAAFQRYGIEGQPAEQTARELGLSIDQVYQAKSRILRRLGDVVAQQVAEEG